MKPLTRLAWTVVFLVSTLTCPVVRGADDWVSLFDGQSLDGWKAAENPGSFHVADGAIVADGPRAHLFYVGKGESADFKNFELRLDVMTKPGANSGVFFHTRYQDEGWPQAGYETQLNNTQPRHGRYYEFKKTGSLYSVRNLYKSVVQDEEWFTMHIAVNGSRIRISLNEILVVDHTESSIVATGGEPAGPRLSSGTFALQCHDPNSRALFKNLRVKRLPDSAADSAGDAMEVDAVAQRLQQLQASSFPLVDFHAHLKGGLTLEQVLAHTRQTGINYGIAINCGLGFPTTTDEQVYAFAESLQGKPVFLAMQAEGREWVNMFSKEAIAQFDYVFTDAMTFTDHKGRRMRLWMDDEVYVDDPQQFMDMLCDRIEAILNNEPINIYVNPTFLPSVIREDYDALWTEPRMQRVVDALAKNDVALEINARYRIPSAAFIKKAKASGVKFTFGTNNTDANLGRLEYCLDMIDECGLKTGDMYMPNIAGSRTDSASD